MSFKALKRYIFTVLNFLCALFQFFKIALIIDLDEINNDKFVNCVKNSEKKAVS